MLDSNILIKLVVAEKGSDKARVSIRKFLGEGYDLYTVDIALSEGLNAIWKHVKVHKDLNPEHARAAVTDLVEIYGKLRVLATRELCEEALERALASDVTVYDALYMAAAEKLRGQLYTADQKLYDEARKITGSILLQT